MAQLQVEKRYHPTAGTPVHRPLRWSLKSETTECSLTQSANLALERGAYVIEEDIPQEIAVHALKEATEQRRP